MDPYHLLVLSLLPKSRQWSLIYRQWQEWCQPWFVEEHHRQNVASNVHSKLQQHPDVLDLPKRSIAPSPLEALEIRQPYH